MDTAVIGRPATRGRGLPPPPDLPGAAGAAIDLYWLPLGAGGHSVRTNGRVFEALVARRERRRPLDLYHSALEVRLAGNRFVIETAPALRTAAGADRGVVGEGAVGSAPLGALRLFRYELRCWLDGVIPDVGEAVDSPRRVSDDPGSARRLLNLVASVPLPVWGRDELRAGEMWNSNSVVAWLLSRSGVPTAAIGPPAGGRAPGWRAGLAVAARSRAGDVSPSARGIAGVGQLREAGTSLL